MMDRLAVGLVLIALLACAPSLVQMAASIPHTEATYIPTPGDDRAEALSDLFSRAASWGFDIEPSYADDHAFGRVLPPLGKIYLRDDLSINAKFEVLAHELAHVFQPPGLTDSQGQVFAELVLDRVAKHYGFSVRDVSAPYLAGNKGGMGIERYVEVDVRFAVDAIVGRQQVRLMNTHPPED